MKILKQQTKAEDFKKCKVSIRGPCKIYGIKVWSKLKFEPDVLNFWKPVSFVFHVTFQQKCVA